LFWLAGFDEGVGVAPKDESPNKVRANNGTEKIAIF
jgi:hypothetical protein